MEVRIRSEVPKWLSLRKGQCMSGDGEPWRAETWNCTRSAHRSCATVFQSFALQLHLDCPLHYNTSSFATLKRHFLHCPSPSPPGTQEMGLPCWRSCYQRRALTTSLRSPSTPSKFPPKTYLIFSFSSYGGQSSPRLPLFDVISRTAFVRPARNSRSELQSSKRRTRNWNRLLTQSPTTSGRRFAMSSATRSCCKNNLLLRWMRKVAATWR